MTVAELREALTRLPDHATVTVERGVHTMRRYVAADTVFRIGVGTRDPNTHEFFPENAPSPQTASEPVIMFRDR